MTIRISRLPATLRKSPRQRRSRDLLAVMVEAGARILASKGMAGFNTRDVAEKAGVSIGSLYQYFPDKQALLDAIRQHHFEQVLAVLKSVPADAMPPARQLDWLLNSLLSLHQQQPGLHAALRAQHIPDAILPDLHHFQSHYHELYRQLLRRWCGGALPDGERSVILFTTTVEAVVHLLASAQDSAPSLLAGLRRMLHGYLGWPPPEPHNPPAAA